MLSSLVFILGASAESETTALFEEIDPKPLSLHLPEEDVKIERYLPEKKIVARMNLTHPLYRTQGRYMIALSDLKKIVGKDTVSYSEKDRIVTVHQMNRLQMAVDRPVYIRQSDRSTIEVYPTFKGDILYVPMRFFLESMGYTVNFDGAIETVLVARENEMPRIVPLRQIEVDAASPYRDGRMKTAVYDLDGGDFIAWGEKVPGGLGSFFRIDEGSRIAYASRLALVAPEDYEARSGRAVGIDAHTVYLYRAFKGGMKRIDRAVFPRDARDLKLDENRLYFKAEEGLFALSIADETLIKCLDGPVKDYAVDRGTVAWTTDDALYVEKDGERIEIPVAGEVDFLLGESCIVVDEKAKGLVHIYDIGARSPRMTTFYDQSKPLDLRLTERRYVSIAQGEDLRLIDIASNITHRLDLINIEPTIQGRRIAWFWNGGILRGYVEADGAKIAQCITIHP